MTQAQTLRTIRDLGLTASVRDGEYRISLKGLSPERAEQVAHYTDDAADAIGTAQLMAKGIWA